MPILTSVLALLAVASFITSIMAMMSKCPITVPVLLMSIVLCLSFFPK